MLDALLLLQCGLLLHLAAQLVFFGGAVERRLAGTLELNP